MVKFSEETQLRWKDIWNVVVRRLGDVWKTFERERFWTVFAKIFQYLFVSLVFVLCTKSLAQRIAMHKINFVTGCSSIFQVSGFLERKPKTRRSTRHRRRNVLMRLLQRADILEFSHESTELCLTRQRDGAQRILSLHRTKFPHCKIVLTSSVVYTRVLLPNLL